MPALRTVGNIVTGDDYQTQSMINCMVLPALNMLLLREEAAVQKETCWCLSNILAGTRFQVQAVCDHNIIPGLIRLLSYGQNKVKKEACWAVSNMMMGGRPDQIVYAVEQGCIPPLAAMLEAGNDAKIIEVALDGLENIMEQGSIIAQERGEPNDHAIYFEEAGGVERLEILTRHGSQAVFEKASQMLDTYFGDGVGDEVHDLAPDRAEGGQYRINAVAPRKDGYDLA